MRTAVPFRQGAVQQPPVLTNRPGPEDEGAGTSAEVGRHVGMPRARCVRQRVLRQPWETPVGLDVAQAGVGLLLRNVSGSYLKERSSEGFWDRQRIYLVVVKQRRLNLPDKPFHLFSDAFRTSCSIFLLCPGTPDVAVILPERVGSSKALVQSDSGLSGTHPYSRAVSWPYAVERRGALIRPTGHMIERAGHRKPQEGGCTARRAPIAPRWPRFTSSPRKPVRRRSADVPPLLFQSPREARLLCHRWSRGARGAPTEPIGCVESSRRDVPFMC